MTGLWQSAWVIARRDFVASVYSRSFILFLVAPLVLVVVTVLMSQKVEEAQRTASQPVVAVVADSVTAKTLADTRERLSAATPDNVFPILRTVDPTENVAVQVGTLLASEEPGYSAAFSGTLEKPILTGPAKVDDTVGRRMQLIVDNARREAALADAGVTIQPLPMARVVTAQAAGNLQMIRAGIARGVMILTFAILVLLATLMLSNLAEEKSNKVIEVLAASVSLDAVFLGKLIAMLGLSFVGLAIWGGSLGLAWLFVQVVQDWVTLPQAGPAVGWPMFALLGLVYYATNFMLTGALFLGIGAQASNLRDIQTLTMPVMLLQGAVLLLALMVIGRDGGALTWFAYIFPPSSPLAMIGLAAQSNLIWPHLLAIVWQLVWTALFIRIASRMFRRTVLKSGTREPFFALLKKA